MASSFYNTREWRDLRERVKRRDDNRCTVARLLGGPCAGRLHVHHIEDVETRPELRLDPDNCATVCAAHHPVWEALRRWLVNRREEAEPRLPACPHRNGHRYRVARIECENERRRRAGLPTIEYEPEFRQRDRELAPA